MKLFYFFRTKSNSSDVATESCETDDSVSEVRPLKRSRVDPFAESCLKFNEYLERFEERQKAKEEDLDDQFLKSIKLMMKDLPESYKNAARGEITTYITNLRAEYLNGLNGTSN